MALITDGAAKDDNLLDSGPTKGHQNSPALDKTKFNILCLNSHTGAVVTWIRPISMGVALVRIRNRDQTCL